MDNVEMDETSCPQDLEKQGQSRPSTNEADMLSTWLDIAASGWTQPRHTCLRYHNSLLIAVGYLDLANGMDFPANVWNGIPTPVFAQVLMGLGGSIALLAVAFAIWDGIRSLSNVRFLWQERKDVRTHFHTADEHMKKRLLRAWIGINFRELGWELVDRMALDICMGISGILVGAGTLMAIRGDIPEVFAASNLLSGYAGNAIIVFYAAMNTVWSGYMWRTSHRHQLALQKHSPTTGQDVMRGVVGRARKHQLYAILMGLTTWIAAVGSMMSAHLWQGYVVMIPSVVGSIWCNWFWRKQLGYDRPHYQEWVGVDGEFDVLQNLVALKAAQRVLKDSCEKSDAHSRPWYKANRVATSSRVGVSHLVGAERFLQELYGYLVVQL